MNRSLILPLAILFGLLCHQWCNILVIGVPYLIFTILLLNFTAVDIKRLRLLRMTGMNISLLLFQILVSLGGYLAAKLYVYSCKVEQQNGEYQIRYTNHKYVAPLVAKQSEQDCQR